MKNLYKKFRFHNQKRQILLNKNKNISFFILRKTSYSNRINNLICE